MNTKDVKDIKIINNDTQKVLNVKEVIWQKEVWYPITGLKQDSNTNFIYIDEDSINKYTPFKVIKAQFNSSFIKRYGMPSIDFDGKDFKGKEISSNQTSNGTGTVIVTFSTKIKEITFGLVQLYEEKNPMFSNIDKVIGLKISIVE